MSSAADSLLTQLPEDTKLQLAKERPAPVRKFLVCKWVPRQPKLVYNGIHVCCFVQPFKTTSSVVRRSIFCNPIGQNVQVVGM